MGLSFINQFITYVYQSSLVCLIFLYFASDILFVCLLVLHILTFVDWRCHKNAAVKSFLSFLDLFLSSVSCNLFPRLWCVVGDWFYFSIWGYSTFVVKSTLSDIQQQLNLFFFIFKFLNFHRTVVLCTSIFLLLKVKFFTAVVLDAKCNSWCSSISKNSKQWSNLIR